VAVITQLFTTNVPFVAVTAVFVEPALIVEFVIVTTPVELFCIPPALTFPAEPPISVEVVIFTDPAPLFITAEELFTALNVVNVDPVIFIIPVLTFIIPPCCADDPAPPVIVAVDIFIVPVELL
jgi:hypothetical protein